MKEEAALEKRERLIFEILMLCDELPESDREEVKARAKELK